eukprot:5091912-Prymnesium_polylepis.1
MPNPTPPGDHGLVGPRPLQHPGYYHLPLATLRHAVLSPPNSLHLPRATRRPPPPPPPPSGTTGIRSGDWLWRPYK